MGWYMQLHTPEPTSITSTSPESLYTIVYNVIRHGGKKEHGSQHKATIMDLDLSNLSSNVWWQCYIQSIRFCSVLSP